MKKNIVMTAVLMLTGAALFARPLVIKLGTPTPSGSEWTDVLLELAEEWEEISGGQVQLKIFPDGVAGNEEDMIRKMKINSLQGAVVSGEGLNGISSYSMIMNLPMLLRSDAEFDYVFRKIRHDFEEDIRQAGFTMVGWTRAGWMYLFSRDPVFTPEDLENQKLASADTDVVMAPILKTVGYHTVPLTLNEIMSALVSGMVDAAYTVPLGAVSYQWFGIANNMLDLPIAPAIGGIIVSNRVWNRIPDKFKPEMKEAVDQAVEHLLQLSRDTEAEVMKIMQEHGLVVHPAPAGITGEWSRLFEQGIQRQMGESFSAEYYSTVMEHLKEFRAGK